MNPIVGTPSYYNDNGNLGINVLFNALNFGLSPAVPTVDPTGAYLTVETNVLFMVGSNNPFTLLINVSAFGNLPIQLIINDTVGVQCFDQNIGAAASLPAKPHNDTAGNTYQGMGERILLHLETEALKVLNGLVVNLSNYPETAQHIQNAAKSLKAAMNG